jgi:hypothetical protein
LLNFKDIAKIFEEIELRLIASLKRNLMRHKAEEIREDRQWTAWQAIKLQNLQKFRRENRQIMQEYSDKIDADTRQLMTEQFREGEQEAEVVAGAEPAASVPDVHFFGVNTPKMERLMQDVVQVEQTAETAALRTMDDVYRRTVNRAQLAMAAGETTLTKAIDMAVREFLEKGLNSIVYRDGRHVDIADYVRMVLRTTSTRAQLQGKSKRFAELGYDTVLISQYGGCSETCEPWQGRAYIDDVFTIWNGEINGDSGKSRYCDKWFPLLSSAIRGGLFHPNCRHTMSLYIDGVTKIPPPVPAEQIRKQRELEQKQRVMERKIRKLKRLEAGTQDPQAVKEYGRKARAAQQELNAFVDEHRDVLKRDYEREKYYGSGVDKSGGSGIIIKERSKKPITEITDKAIESVPKIKIDGYTDEQCELIQQHHKELLKYSRDNNDNKEVAFVMDSSMSSRKEFIGSDDKLDFGSELYGKDLFVMHNHPRNSSYSITDLIFFRNSTNVKTLTIITNSGGVEFITKTSEFDGNKYKLEYDRLYKKIVLTGTESEKDKFVRTFLRKTKSGVIWNERQK